MPVILPRLIAAATLLCAGTAWAQEPVVRGAPTPWQMNFQPAASPVMDMIESLHDLLLFIIVVISAFVLGLLAFACFRFRADRNPEPSRRTHNTVLEIAWTAIPVLILVVIAIPSFKLLYFMDRAANPAMTLKAIGHQWYWSYVYPDNGNFTFDARMVTAEEAVAKQQNVVRLLDTDEEVVLPIGKNIRIQITSEDVIHSWTIPSFGIKHDAVPGRINESWFNIEKPGIYYGQCSELCGMQHAYMPIKVRAVSPEEFDAWVKQAQGKYDKLEAPAASIAPTKTDGSSQLASATQVQTAN
jgi:cytochrome c oxidase subunit 2